MTFSIITCFFESRERLRPYLDCLRQLQLDGVSTEIIFVDNASGDNTAELLQQALPSLPTRARLLREQEPGLMHARCRGVAAAEGKYVVFFDDDNEPCREFLQNLSLLIEQHPEAVGFTGNCVLPPEYRLPNGVQDALEVVAVRNESGEKIVFADRFSPAPMPWGAGLVVKRPCILEACEAWKKGDQKVVGRKGHQLSGGEDLWIVHFITRHGGFFVFSDKLELTHRVSQHRLHPCYLGRIGLSYGMEHIETTEAIKSFKPDLKTTGYEGVSGYFLIWVKLLVYSTKCLIKPTAGGLVGIAAKLGLLYSIMLRRVERGGRP